MIDRQARQAVRRTLRLLLALAALFLILLILLLVLQLTESAVTIWRTLDELSPLLLGVYAGGLLVVGLLLAILGWWLLKPRRRSVLQGEAEPPRPVQREALERALATAESAGVDTGEARHELAEMQRREETRAPYLAFFGAVSTGKSALIRAITGEQGIGVDPRAGTTRQVTHYRFADGEATELVLSDAPGILDPDRERVRIAREEARRADLVIYVCDGELTRDQYAEAESLLGLRRPMIVAFNKLDRYDEADLAAIMARLRRQLPGIAVVPVQAGGEELVVRVDARGEEQQVLRERPARIESLMAAIHEKLATEGPALLRRRDESLLHLGAEKLAAATRRHRREQSERLVKQYARKAMLGALAAVSPGTDLLIQGYLGVQMVGALTRLYEVQVRQTDLERFIEQASRHLGKRLTLLLALAGNVLKAFPGVGTVTGGLLHAVAYGMVFEGLGQAVARSLEEDGELQAPRALDYFEEKISGNLEGRAKFFARLALDEWTAKK